MINIKISSVIALLLSAVHAQFNLRAVADKFLGHTPSSSTDPATVRLVIHGLTQAVSPQDLDLIHKSVVETYNSAYETAGYAMDSFQATMQSIEFEPVGIDCRFCPPDDDAMIKTTQSQFLLGQAQLHALDIDCRHCPPDDDAMLGNTPTPNIGDMHQSFQDHLCAALRVSGSANLVHVHDCAFVFVDEQHDDMAGLDLPMDLVTPSQAQLTMQGMLHDLSEDDQAWLDTSLVAVYNDVMVDGSLELVETVMDLDLMPTVDIDCRFCPPDDDAMLSTSQAAKMMIVRVKPVDIDCRFCPPDDDATLLQQPSTTNQKHHEAFETTFCGYLVNSGRANFAQVHDCHFSFVHNPIGHDVEAMQ